MSVEELYKKALAFNQDPSNSDKFSPDNTQRLKFYAYFKQINSGQCKGSAPSRLKVVERAKYDAWKALGNISKEEAMKGYIKTLTEAYPKWNGDAVPKL
mmetsp:Transcript_7469/g.6796  ORF Transcript_7469/g.6796 Transcript_7469/m.6796 type:complete len:99 (+) Transcript_7469:47-343(+)